MIKLDITVKPDNYILFIHESWVSIMKISDISSNKLNDKK